MKVQRSLFLAAAVMPLVSTVAFAQTFAISLGVRETGSAGAIGSNGGAAGNIEWINKDGQSLLANGTWQQFTFNFGTDSVAPFPAGTSNGILDGSKGVFEHIRFLNSNGVTDGITLYIDDVINTVGGIDTPLTDFESYQVTPNALDATKEVMFRNPRLSGSTQTNLVANDTANVSADFAHGGVNSYRMSCQFVDSSAIRYIRMSTFNTTNLPNPVIDFTSGNKVSFWLLAAVAEPSIRWIAPGDGNWNDTLNWNNGTVATGTSATANFLSAATAPATVTVDAPVSANLLRFKNTNAYTLAGSSTITLTGPNGFTGNINVELGSHVISAPMIQLDRGAQVTVNAGASLSITQPVIQNLAGGGGTEVNTLSFTKSGGGTLNLNKMNVATLTVSDAGVLNLAAGSGASRASFLSMSTVGIVPTGKLNLANNTVVYDLDESTATLSTQLATTIGRVKNAYASGAWTGTGVTSANAQSAAATSDKTGIAVFLASDLGVAGGTFENVAISGDGIILKYALIGDSNLDSKVNTLDFNLLAGNFGGATDIRWSKGDFDYDADVDSIDFDAFVANYGKTLATAAPSLGAVVPEPVSMGLLMIPAFAAMRRRRR